MMIEFAMHEDRNSVILQPDRVSGNGAFRLQLAEKDYSASLEQVSECEYLLRVDGACHRVFAARDGDSIFLKAGGRSWCVRAIDPLAEIAARKASSEENSVFSPMPGVVLSVPVAEGDTVVEGQTLIVIESMKLETSMAASRSGVVEKVHVREGDTFDLKEKLVSLSATE